MFCLAIGDLSYAFVFVGDATVSNPISWLVTDLAIKLEKAEEKAAGAYQPKPEIKHLFRYFSFSYRF